MTKLSSIYYLSRLSYFYKKEMKDWIFFFWNAKFSHLI